MLHFKLIRVSNIGLSQRSCG